MASLLDNIAPPYNPDESYSFGAKTLNNDRLYQCNKSTTGPFDPDAWTEIYLSELIQGIVDVKNKGYKSDFWSIAGNESTKTKTYSTNIVSVWAEPSTSSNANNYAYYISEDDKQSAGKDPAISISEDRKTVTVGNPWSYTGSIGMRVLVVVED